MRYVSTRGRAAELGFCDALLAGLATDGGLYVPQTWPKNPTLAGSTYASKAASLMAPYVEGEIPQDVFAQLCATAYSTFRDPAVVPLVQIAPEHYLLELFHGPTLAFKDIALQLIGQLFDYVLTQRNQRVMIVGATSGDTGSAAIDGVKSCNNVDIVILYPAGRVSDVQRRQMTTVDSPNVHTVAIDGTFDDCQDLVKAMFNDAQFRNELNLSAVNSINWARVMAQTVYYVAAIDALGDQPVSFSVPTGNFGNVLAGWIAREMGASVDSLIVGSNKNDILTRFFESHQMVADGVVPTLSPSMDIQVSSNFERLLFEMNDRDGAVTAHQLSTFRSTGQLAVEPDQFATWAAPVFKAARCNDELTLSTMADVYRESGMLIDPHTAVGVSAARQLRGQKEDQSRDSGVPVVTLATAHPAKFPDAVIKATGVHPNLPEHLADLLERPERTNNLANDLAAVQAFVRSVAR